MKTFPRIWMLAGSLARVSLAPATEAVGIKRPANISSSLIRVLREICGWKNVFLTADCADHADPYCAVELGRQTH